MSTTLAQFKVVVLRALQDASQKTFTDPYPLDFINAGLSTLGRVAPARFREDIDLIAGTLDYQLQASVLPDATPEIEVIRVELWDGTTSPVHLKEMWAPVSQNETNHSGGGWLVWNGSLQITERQLACADTSTDILRVWGYRPYPLVANDSDVMPVSQELLDALRTFVRMEGLEQLEGDRELFTQWQVRSNNTDVTMASLMSALQSARQAWYRKQGEITVLREAPG